MPPESQRDFRSMTMKPALISAVKVVVTAAIIFTIGSALGQNWPAVARTATHLDATWLGVAFAICLAYRVANACGWPLVLSALRRHMPMARGARLWLVSETMRWLPGSVWGFYSRVHQARKIGVPPATASMSVPLELILTIAAWTITAIAGLGSSGVLTNWLSQFSASRLGAAAGIALGTFAFGLLLARRFPENRHAKKARGFAADLRAVFAERPRVSLLLATFALYLVLCVLNGLAFYALIRAFTPATPSPSVVVGINAVGWLVGFFAVCAPGGLGVREGGMTALLAPLVPMEIAIGSVLAWRLMQIAVEIACLAACFIPDGFRFAKTWLRPPDSLANFAAAVRTDEAA